MDPVNPTCPLNPSWSTNRTMVLTPVERNGVKILLAEGRVDSGLPERLKAGLATHPGIAEIWLSSPGSAAPAGNADRNSEVLGKSVAGCVARGGSHYYKNTTKNT